jgi:peptidylprolyl isomerase
MSLQRQRDCSVGFFVAMAKLMMRVIPLLFVSSASSLRVPSMSRRQAAFSLAAACTCPLPASAKRLAEYTDDEQDELDLSTRKLPGVRLPSGIRVIQVTEVEDGAPAVVGERVYVHFKIWNKGFRAGTPADSSFLEGRPYDWFLGKPPPRIIRGIDEGMRGMREGEWRRLVVPSQLAYGEAGLAKGSKGALAVQPNEDVYVDVLLFDTAACDAAVRQPGKNRPALEFAHDGTAKSVTCKRFGSAGLSK